MPDVARKCTKCEAEVVVSKVAERFVCPGCGTQVTVVSAEGTVAAPDSPVRKEKLRIRDEIGAHSEGPEVPKKPAFFGRKRNEKPVPTRPKDRGSMSTTMAPHHVGSWLLFFAVGGCMAGCRYGGWLDFSRLAGLETASPYVLLALYLMTLLTIFKDSVFAGILSLLIPPYSLYYLLVVSDRFALRALVLGLLVGIGEYSAAFITVHWTRLVEMVHAYIASGG